MDKCFLRRTVSGGLWVLHAAVISLLGTGCVNPGAESSFAGLLRPASDAGRQIEARFGGTCKQGIHRERIGETTKRIASVVPNLNVSCRCILLDSDELAALSLSDGRIYLTQGLYQTLEDTQLAAIIAHEIAHVAARDGKSGATGESAQLGKELRADRNACTYLAAAGYPTSGLAEALRLMSDQQPPGWFEIRLKALAKDGSLDGVSAQ